MIRIVLLFLAALAVLALVASRGRRRMSGRRGRSTPRLERARICPNCARVNVGDDHCTCDRG